MNALIFSIHKTWDENNEQAPAWINTQDGERLNGR